MFSASDHLEISIRIQIPALLGADDADFLSLGLRLLCLIIDISHDLVHIALDQRHVRLRGIMAILHSRRFRLDISAHRSQDHRIDINLPQCLTEHLDRDGPRS